MVLIYNNENFKKEKLMKNKSILGFVLAAVFSSAVYAQVAPASDPVFKNNEKTKLEPKYEAINNKIKSYFNNRDVVTNISEAPMDNTYLVSLDDGTSFVYFEKTDYAVLGDIYDLKDKSNLTPEIKANFYKKILDTYPLENGIHYEPTVEKIGTAYIFTDPTCGYCRKLHHELQSYLDKGIEIVYIPYPRSGVTGPGHDELVDVFNAGDNNAEKLAMDLAKTDRSAEIKMLPTYKSSERGLRLVNEGVETGKKLGIRGTPSIYLSNGYNIPGYIDSETLAKVITEQKSKTNEK